MKPYTITTDYPEYISKAVLNTYSDLFGNIRYQASIQPPERWYAESRPKCINKIPELVDRILPYIERQPLLTLPIFSFLRDLYYIVRVAGLAMKFKDEHPINFLNDIEQYLTRTFEDIEKFGTRHESFTDFPLRLLNEDKAVYNSTLKIVLLYTLMDFKSIEFRVMAYRYLQSSKWAPAEVAILATAARTHPETATGLLVDPDNQFLYRVNISQPMP